MQNPGKETVRARNAALAWRDIRPEPKSLGYNHGTRAHCDIELFSVKGVHLCLRQCQPNEQLQFYLRAGRYLQWVNRFDLVKNGDPWEAAVPRTPSRFFATDEHRKTGADLENLCDLVEADLLEDPRLAANADHARHRLGNPRVFEILRKPLACARILRLAPASVSGPPPAGEVKAVRPDWRTLPDADLMQWLHGMAQPAVALHFEGGP